MTGQKLNSTKYLLPLNISLGEYFHILSTKIQLLFRKYFMEVLRAKFWIDTFVILVP